MEIFLTFVATTWVLTWVRRLRGAEGGVAHARRQERRGARGWDLGDAVCQLQTAPGCAGPSPA